MGPRIVFASAITTGLLLAAAAAPSLAQPRPGQLPPSGGGAPHGQPAPAPQQRPPQQQQQQQQVAAKPYKPVAIRAPQPINDPSFEAFRKQVGAAAEKKDRRALAALVDQNFFWLGENGDKADKKRPAIDNMVKALGLGGKDAPGWDMLAGAASDPTGTPYPDRKDTVCSPADPEFDQQQLEDVAKSTGTDMGDWAYPTQPGLEVRSGPQPNAPVVEKLGLHFVLVLPDNSNNSNNQQNPMIRVGTPSGKTGYVPAEALNPLGGDQLCYTKQGNTWKISGFIGGDEQQQ